MNALNHSGRLALAGMVSLPVVAAWLFFPQLANAFESKHHILYLGAMAIVLALVASGQIARCSLPRGWIGAGLFVWLLGVGLSFFAAQNGFLAGRLALEIAADLLLAYALFNLRDPRMLLGKLEGGLIVAGLGVAVFALKQFMAPNWLDPGFSALGKLQIYSTLGNPNISALVILPAVPLAIGRAVKGAGWARMGYVISSVVLLCGLGATQARHAFIALLAMACVVGLWKGTPAVRRIVLVLLPAAACGGVALLLIDLPPSVLHSIEGRAFIWLTSLQMLLEHPLTGVGLGQYGLNHLIYQGEMFQSGHFDAFFDNAAVITEGHNDFLNWGAMSGLAGLAGFTSLCVSTLILGWRSDTLRQVAPGIYLAFVGYVAAMFFIAVSFYTVPGLFFWLVLGAVWAIARPPHVDLAFKPQLKWGLAATLFVLLAADVPTAWHETRGEYLEAQADRLMEEHDLWLARKEYQSALLEYPHNGNARKKYATTLYLSGELPQALEELGLCKHDSGDLGINLLEGELRARMGDLEGAAAVYRQVVASFPNLVGAHFILGQIYHLQGRDPEADAEFRKVLAIRPSPFNLNLTREKVDLQKQLVREYLERRATKSGAVED